MLNGDPVQSDLNISDQFIVLEVVNKVTNMTKMSKLLTATSLLDEFTSCD